MGPMHNGTMRRGLYAAVGWGLSPAPFATRIDRTVTSMVNATNWDVLRATLSGSPGQHSAECSGCGLWLLPGDRVYRVPRLRGWQCSVECAETALFGQEHCRWCGAGMSKAYAGIGSRLCSEDCEANYDAHVLGDRTARLGTGKRLMLWLQRCQPDVFRRLIGAATAQGRYCQNPNCKRGEIGQPAGLDHLREGSRFCSPECRVEAHRNGGPHKVLTDDFQAAETRI